MTEILNAYDKALHDAIHEAMLNQDPALLLNNKRLSIIPIIEARVAEVHGLIADVGCGERLFRIYLAKNFDRD